MSPHDNAPPPPPPPAAVAELARADVRALTVYSRVEAPYDVDVSDNINLWGAPPAAIRVLREMQSARISRYPSPYGGTLKDAIRSYTRASEADVIVGCGSDDVLDCAMRAFGAPGDRIAFCVPTFSMIPVFARLNGLTAVAIPLREDFDIDAERLVAARAKLLYICAPNNPTATAASRRAIEHVIERSEAIVIVDEAYAEFAALTHADLLAGSERLLITRTFSKAFGLAGLRVGYGLGSRALVSMVERARGPYKVNAAAEAAAMAALQDDADGLQWMRAHAALAVDIRQRLAKGLEALGLEVLPSDANFVFVPTARAMALAARLRERGVLVGVHRDMPRDIPAFAVSDGAGLRIGVGPWEMMEKVLEALAQALRERTGSP